MERWKHNSETVRHIHVFLFVFEYHVPPTTKFIWRRDLVLKSHPMNWKSGGSNPGPLVYKVIDLFTTSWMLLHTYIYSGTQLLS